MTPHGYLTWMEKLSSAVRSFSRAGPDLLRNRPNWQDILELAETVRNELQGEAPAWERIRGYCANAMRLVREDKWEDVPVGLELSDRLFEVTQLALQESLPDNLAGCVLLTQDAAEANPSSRLAAALARGLRSLQESLGKLSPDWCQLSVAAEELIIMVQTHEKAAKGVLGESVSISLSEVLEDVVFLARTKTEPRQS